MSSQADADSWQQPGRLARGRTGHTATLLPSGQVLVVGGSVNFDLLASAELYDPSTGLWTTVPGPLQDARSNHTATLLPSGQVLVAGGFDDFGQLASAELYDPSTGLWTPVPGPLQDARTGHTATLLPSGQVLVAGGFDDFGLLASAELYDPSTGLWTPVPDPLHDARSDHTATLLPSGQVLVAGGDGNSGLLASVELYDPSTRLWTSGPDPLQDARWLHTATLLPSGQVLVAGGLLDLPLASAELYDPSTGLWTPVPDLLQNARSSHTATLLPSGQVLVAGGLGNSVVPLASAELYGPSTGPWTRVPDPLQNARSSHTATLLPSGQMLVAGGKDDNSVPLASAELYDFSTRLWTPVPDPLQDARSDHTATLLLSGQVLVAGGVGDNSVPLASAESYDPSTGLWTTVPDPLHDARGRHTATLLPSGQVLVAGGEGVNSVPLASAELYDPSTGLWTPVPDPLHDARSDHTATLLPSGQVLVAGGKDDNSVPLASAELYDPSTGLWTPVPDPLHDARGRHTATLLPSGQVLVAGGEGNFLALASAELYDPSTRLWTTVTVRLQFARFDHTATLLPSGQVLVAGGFGIFSQQPSAELYNPSTGLWTPGPDPLQVSRHDHTATLLPSGQVLVAGGLDDGSVTLASADLYGFDSSRRPVITALPPTLDYLSPIEVIGTGFGGDSEASGGGRNSSAVNFPLVQLRAIEGDAVSWLVPEPRPNFSDDPMTLTASEVRPIFHPGWHLLTVVTAGVPSESTAVTFQCSLGDITGLDPERQTVAVGERATFGPVGARGGRLFQWQQCQGDRGTTCAAGGSGWIDIPGATAPSYTTTPITGPESGTRYRVVVGSGCTSATSGSAVLTVFDETPPGCASPDCTEPTDPPVAVVTPDGGELWPLSQPDEPNSETISWTMSDNIRVCQVELELRFSTDGGQSFGNVSRLPSQPSFDLGPNCAHPGLETTSTTVALPEALPAGEEGVLYKVRLTVTDHAGNTSVDESDRPFFIVRPNNDSVETLILWHEDRMTDLLMDTAGLADALVNFAAHPRVRGRIVDLGGFPDLENLYEQWDAGQADANDVLFGSGGLHDRLSELLAVFTGVEYLVLVGDDRVIPLARIDDDTTTSPEEVYPDPASGDLTADGTTVGQALAANRYLSDDPLASLKGLTPSELEDGPDLAVGRLVETPAEIVASIATFISQEGILDLTRRDNKVLVSAYDFLVDSGTKIRDSWDAHLADGVERGSLIGQGWRSDQLEDLLCEASTPYGVLNLNGHATHYEAGHPSGDPFNIVGLDTSRIAGNCALPGSLIYAVGCHSGLPVAGSTDPDGDHPQDLPQTMLGAGAMVYLANTGYGWGLKNGVGYSERLVEIFTAELTAGDTVIVGEAVKRTKQLYSLNAPRFDVYDEKVSKQWTLYGFPMYTLRTRDAEAPRSAPRRLFEGPPPRLEDMAQRDSFGPVTLERRALGRTLTKGVVVSPPPFLTRLELAFDFSADGVYKKFNAAGREVDLEEPCDTPEGCYYALNNVSSGQDLATGTTDRPLQPLFVFDSRLSGTSFHGFLWKGGRYVEERDWVPLIAELQSNVPGQAFDGGSLPSPAKSNGRGKVRRANRGSLDSCPASDLDVSSLVLEAGEVLREAASGLPDVQRRYETVNVEMLYFNNTTDPGENCDALGPEVTDVRHQAMGTTVDLEVEASDPDGVWRVLVVWNDGAVDVDSRGFWRPLELELDGASGTWRGSVQAPGATRLTYFVQAVDNKGNVTVPVSSESDVPPSGVPLGLPELITVDLAPRAPAAGFTWSPRSPVAGEEVRFNDTSSGQPGSWQWSFPDGSGSAERDPVYVFAQPGSFPVTLTVANSLGSDSITRTVIVAEEDNTCTTATALCLNDNRFEVEVDWRDFEGNTGSGQVVPAVSDDSGLFWFFSADNWEMLVKVLDGCTITDHFWVFAAATTNVEYTLRVTDSETGAVMEYFNPLGNAAAAITDTSAFATCPLGGRHRPLGGSSSAPSDQRVLVSPASSAVSVRKLEPSLTAKQSTCSAGATHLCLNRDRFRVEVDWRDSQDNAGTGQVVPFGSDDSGLFWFFSADNWEMLVKVLDGCSITDHFWVFAAATTNVEYTLRVTDTQTGAVVEYLNTLGNAAAAITDTGALATCP